MALLICPIKLTKKIILFFIILVLLISCNSNKKRADMLFEEARHVPFGSIQNSYYSLTLLDNAILLNPKDWKYYKLKNVIYDQIFIFLVQDDGVENQEQLYENIAAVYESFERNTGKLDTKKKFELACTYFKAGQNKKAMDIFQEQFNKIYEITKTPKVGSEEEKQLFYGVLSGFFLGKVSQDNICGYIKFLNQEGFVYQAIIKLITGNSKRSLAYLFDDFYDEYGNFFGAGRFGPEKEIPEYNPYDYIPYSLEEEEYEGNKIIKME